jgi:hypothetical protein
MAVNRLCTVCGVPDCNPALHDDNGYLMSKSTDPELDSFLAHQKTPRETSRGTPATTSNIRPNYYRALARVKLNPRFDDEPEYTDAFVECFDLIDALKLDFYLGNALKYLWRAGKKDGASKVDDLKKIRTYIDAALQRVGEDND